MLVAQLLAWASDPVPAPEDVKAGWLGFAVFVALAVAVALLGWSLSRQLKKTRENAEAGVFDPSDPRPGRQQIPVQPPAGDERD